MTVGHVVADGRLLLTHFGTLVYADEAGRLRHGDLRTAPRNVRMVAADALSVDGRPLPVELSRSDRGDRVGIRQDGLYLSAGRDGSCAACRTGWKQWENFLPVTEEWLADLLVLGEQDWTLRGGERVRAEEIVLEEGFVLRFGPCSIRLDIHEGALAVTRSGAGPVALSFLHDGWRVNAARAYRPLIYFTVFGPDPIFEMLGMALRSLAAAGGYDGDVLIVADRAAEAVAPFVPPGLAGRTTVVVRPVARRIDMLAARFHLSDLPIDGHQPVLYMDADVVCTGPVGPLLDRINRGTRFHAATEMEGVTVCRSGPGKRAWFGSLLFTPEEMEVEPAYCLNSGVIGFPNKNEAMPVFQQIWACMKLFAADRHDPFRWGDQPFASYILQKRGLVEFGLMNEWVRLVRGGRRPRPGQPGPPLVHFNVGVAREAKMEMMADFLRRAEAEREAEMAPS